MEVSHGVPLTPLLSRWLRRVQRTLGFKPLLQLSLTRSQQAWKAGRDASYAGYHRGACPFAAVPGQRMEREAWMRGFSRGERDARPATE